VVEGSTITYTATVDNAVTGTPLVLSLSNGQSITIAVGQTTGSVSYAVRADDAYVQGSSALPAVSITGNSGGNFENVATTGTVLTSVTDDADSSTVTLSSTAPASVVEGSTITYTATVDNAVTGTPLVLSLSNGQSITIAVGQTTGSVSYAVRADDAYVQGSSALPAVSITGNSGGNFENVATTGTVLTSVTDDADSSTVTLSSTAPASVVEGSTITYTATVDNAVTGTPLVLSLSNGQSITIAVGQTTGSVSYAVRADDAYVQGSSALPAVSITGNSGGNFENVATTGTVLTSVTDDADSSTVTLSSTAPASVVEGSTITYTATVDNAVTGTPLVLSLSNGQSITIAVGQTTGSVSYAVRADDAYVQGSSALPAVSITGNSGGNFENVATTGTVLTSVTDDADSSTVTLSSTAPASVVEGSTITYTATVDNAVTGTPLVLSLSNGQSITIAVGQTTGSVSYAVRADDAYVQGSSALPAVSITGNSGGNFENVATTGTVLTSVTDDADSSTVTLSSTAPASVVEGSTITYTATVDNAVTGTPLVLSLSNGQSITIAVGQTTGSVSYAVRADDAYVQGSSALPAVSITGNSGGNFENVATTGTVLTSVTDDADSSTVTLSSTAPASVVEGSTITYTATVDNAVTGTPLVLSLSNGQSITIAVGQTTGSVSYAVRADDAYVQGSSALPAVSITGNSGGNFENVATTGTVLTSVTDDADSSTVTLSSTAPASVVEGSTITYTATVDNAVTGTPLVLSLSNGQSITIAVGQTTGSVSYAVRADDAYVQGSSALPAVSITGNSGGNFENVATTGTVLTSVTDDADSSTVTLSSTAPASVVEGSTITYTATVDNAVTGTPLVLSLSNGQSITIAVGQTTGSVSYAVRADDAYVQGSSALPAVSITGNSGGNFENVATTGRC
jgi:surface adhesion protein